MILSRGYSGSMEIRPWPMHRKPQIVCNIRREADTAYATQYPQGLEHH